MFHIHSGLFCLSPTICLSTTIRLSVSYYHSNTLTHNACVLNTVQYNTVHLYVYVQYVLYWYSIVQMFS